MLVDVTLNDLKKLFVAGSRLLRFEKGDLIYLYYVQQGPVIFRTIIQRPDTQMGYHMLLNTLPQNMLVLNVIEDGLLETQMLLKLNQILMKLEEMNDIRISA